MVRRVRLAGMKPKFRMRKVPGGHLFPVRAAARGGYVDRPGARRPLRRSSSIRMFISTPTMLGLTSSARRNHSSAVLLVLELQVDLAQPGERAEVAGIALEHLVAVGDRLAVVAGEVVDRGAAVPAFGELGFFPHHLLKSAMASSYRPACISSVARAIRRVDLGVARAGPEQPQALLGEAAHEGAFVAQPLVQQRRVGHACRGSRSTPPPRRASRHRHFLTPRALRRGTGAARGMPSARPLLAQLLGVPSRHESDDWGASLHWNT